MRDSRAGELLVRDPAFPALGGWLRVTASDVGLERAEQALRDEDERRRILTDSVPDLLWSATPDGFASAR